MASRLKSRWNGAKMVSFSSGSVLSRRSGLTPYLAYADNDAFQVRQRLEAGSTHRSVALASPSPTLAYRRLLFTQPPRPTRSHCHTRGATHSTYTFSVGASVCRGQDQAIGSRRAADEGTVLVPRGAAATHPGHMERGRSRHSYLWVP